MLILNNDQLTRIVGAYTMSNDKGSYSQSNYESCLQDMERRAAEKYPDARTWFGRLIGTTDENAGRRANYFRDAVRTACGCPPKR